MIELGLPVALATDFNPGTCLIYSMLTIIGLAVMKMGLSVEDAITAATLNAACALDLAEEIGSLEEGKAADLVVLELDTYRQIPYFFGHNPVRLVISGGKVVHERRA
jgi:imidazolonepropionase